MVEIRHKILLAEDDLNLGELLKHYLELNEFDVHWHKNGVEALKAFNTFYYDLCLLDVMMPEMTGLQLAAEIKRVNPALPLLFLTAKSLKEDMLTGYKCGADDYILKPFDSELLMFKIRAILKRTASAVINNNHEFTIGKYKLNSHTQSLSGPSGERRLSTKETELLKLLCQYKNDLLPRELALKNIWGADDYFNARSMDVYITKIRKYIKDDPSLEIVNVHGRGFRLNTGAVKVE